VTTLANRPQTALLVIDVQVGVVEDAWDRDGVIGRIREAVEGARAAGLPVIWVQHSDEGMSIDSAEWQIVPELSSIRGEPHVLKKYRSSFEETTLSQILADKAVGRVILAGAQTNNCIRHTLHAALEQGYDVVLLEDAHTTSSFQWDNGPVSAVSIIAEQNASTLGYELPGRRAHLSTVRDFFA
jgi:nicotinamidase-related amidase